MAFPDAEDLLLTMLTPVGYACTAMPDEPWDTHYPIIHVARTGGGIDIDGITDRAMCTITTFGPDRPTAWAAARACRDVILASGCTSVNGALIDTAREQHGTEQFPDFNPENKMVMAIYWLSFREMPQ